MSAPVVDLAACEVCGKLSGPHAVFLEALAQAEEATFVVLDSFEDMRGFPLGEVDPGIQQHVSGWVAQTEEMAAGLTHFASDHFGIVDSEGQRTVFGEHLGEVVAIFWRMRYAFLAVSGRTREREEQLAGMNEQQKHDFILHPVPVSPEVREMVQAEMNAIWSRACQRAHRLAALPLPLALREQPC